MGLIVSPPEYRGRSKNTVLCLPGDGVVDTSLSGKIMTNTGVSIVDASGTGKPAGIAKAMSFETAASKLTTPNHADFDFGTGDFLIEAWVCPTSWSTTIGRTIYGQYYDDNNKVDLVLYDNTIRLYQRIATVEKYAQANCEITPGVYTHLSWSRVSGSVQFRKDGVLKPLIYNNLTGSETFNIPLGFGAVINVGFWSQGGYSFPGKIANLRVVKGSAVWTRNFTPPPLPF